MAFFSANVFCGTLDYILNECFEIDCFDLDKTSTKDEATVSRHNRFV